MTTQRQALVYILDTASTAADAELTPEQARENFRSIANMAAMALEIGEPVSPHEDDSGGHDPYSGGGAA